MFDIKLKTCKISAICNTIATLAIGAFGIFLLQMADKVKRFTVYPKLLPDDS